MTPAARVQAAIEILDQVADGKPAEQALTGWARRSRYAGSGDRAAIRDHVFDVLRQRASCAVLGGGDRGRALMLGLLRRAGTDPATVFTGATYAPASLSEEELSASAAPLDGLPDDLPDWLRPQLSESLGERLAQVAQALRHRAPAHLRVNLRKTTRAKARAALQDEGISTQALSASPTALEVIEGQRKLRQSPSYLDGLVELQDAASQAVVDRLPLEDGQRVLDFCAGGGGKALAMAARARLTLDAHDSAPERMKDIAPRAARAGARITCLATEDLSGPYDLVLCDAPCSGSGAWRRAPEAKWRLTAQALAELTTLQDQILDQASGLVVSGGVLAYATCSLLRAENEDRIERFTARTDWQVTHQERWWPDEGTDGFFLTLLKR